MYSQKLYKSIINDRAAHPERLNATFERIEEVCAIVIGERAVSLLEDTAKKIKDKRKPLADEIGNELTMGLGNRCSPMELNSIADLLMDSELTMDEAIDLHEKYKIPVSHLEKDIIPVRGDGAWIIDIHGDAFLDMDSNYSATNLGMSNSEIALGLFNQANQLISMKEDRVHVPRTRFLKEIHQMMPEGLTNFYWQNSGGEAVDKALKIAKAFTQHKGVVAMKGGFHGRTHGAVAVTHEPGFREPFFLDNEEWVHFVDFNDADAVEKLFEEDKARTVIVELVQGEGAGVRPAERSFPKQLEKICDKYGGVLIADEIQSGFGRTAEKKNQWFASVVYGITPQIMTIGKSFGGGYPVTAVVTNKEISQKMKGGYDGSTFGGNPMAMVAALIATRQMREKDLTGNVIQRSKQLMDGFEKLKKEHECLRDFRGLGLMLSLQLRTTEDVAVFQSEIKKHGVKTSLSTDDWVRFLPPLILSESEAAFLLNGINETLKHLSCS